MSNINSSIGGHTFSFPRIRKEGDTISADEALQLDQTRVENIGNQVRKLVQEAVASKDAKKIAEMEKQVLQRYQEYVPNARAIGGRDPIQRLERQIATSVAKQLAENGGQTWSKLDKDAKDKAIDKVLSNEGLHTKISSLAKKQHEENQRKAQEVSSLLSTDAA